VTAPAELDRIERQLAQALKRGRQSNGYTDGSLEPVHESPVYRELVRLSTGEVSHTRVPIVGDERNR
jgi:hypothetical protein